MSIIMPPSPQTGPSRLRPKMTAQIPHGFGALVLMGTLGLFFLPPVTTTTVVEVGSSGDVISRVNTSLDQFTNFLSVDIDVSKMIMSVGDDYHLADVLAMLLKYSSNDLAFMVIDWEIARLKARKQWKDFKTELEQIALDMLEREKNFTAIIEQKEKFVIDL